MSEQAVPGGSDEHDGAHPPHEARRAFPPAEVAADSRAQEVYRREHRIDGLVRIGSEALLRSWRRQPDPIGAREQNRTAERHSRIVVEAIEANFR